MSYDIELKNKVTGETATMRHPQYVRGGNVPARLNPMTGELEPTEQVEAHINITYNYSHYYYEASDLHMIKFQHITLTEHMALLKPNTESAACMERLPLNQSRC